MERIEVKRIRPSPSPLRDTLGNITELGKSIEEKGLLQPLIVRPSGNGYFQVIAGNRRLAACKLFNWKKVLCYVADFSDKDALEVSIIENVQHQSLSSIEEARAFKRYVKDNGYGAISELARRIGKSPSYVSRRIALLELPESLQVELLKGHKSSSVAQELISLDEEYKNEIARMIFQTRMSSNEVRKIVKKIKSGEDLIGTYRSSNYKRQRMIESVMDKCNTSFKVCLMRFDEALDNLDKDEWVLWDALMQYRIFIHQQIDTLLNLKKKTRKYYRLNYYS
jgi:ParB family transcriptional regulator, chromosome partitioning protein